jgi:surface protein
MSFLFSYYFDNSETTLSSCGTSFNSDIGNWNTSSCTTMEGMFYHAEAFNQITSQWNVDGVETMQSMFMNANAFNQVLCWKLSSVRITNTDDMFSGSSGSLGWIGNDGACVFLPTGRSELQTAVRSWAADSAYAASMYGHIRTWNTSLITDMSYLFYTEPTYDDHWDDDNGEPDFSSFNDNIDSWDVSSVTNMG